MGILASPGTRQVVGDARAVEHLGLRLYEYLPSELIDDRTLKQSALRAIQESSDKLLPPEVLAAVAARRLETARAVPGELAGPLELRLTSALTIGMANRNLVENGLTLMRPYGIPMIPGSAVKGTVSAFLAEIIGGTMHVNQEDRAALLGKKLLLPLFGWGPSEQGKSKDEGQSGRVAFFDALLVKGAFTVDVTTVHHAKYYQGEGTAPAGFESPVPIPFPAVAAGSMFQFLAVTAPGMTLPALPAEVKDRLQEFDIRRVDTIVGFIEDAVAATGFYRGFGCQTNVGYGRFEKPAGS
jgi:CRISPR-associated protein Cmr6